MAASQENTVEFVPCEEGITAIVTTPDGKMKTFSMSWEEFGRLKAQIDPEDDG